VQYSYDDQSVIAVNTTYQPQRKLKLTAQVFDLKLAEKFSKTTELNLAADSNSKAFSIPHIKDLSATYFLKLTLQNSTGQIVSSNFYWLSTTDDVLDKSKTKWYYTPVSSYADMTQLEKLPPVKLAVSGRTVRRGGEEIAHVSISNPGRGLAFFVHLQIKHGTDERDVLPILWKDNYISLLPGERREVTATYKVKDLGNGAAFLKVEGWNSVPIKIPLAVNKKQ
jgi:exo-1,4-beta-D-glucosaminidase